MQNHPFTQKILDLLAKDQLSQALQNLQMLLKDSPKLNEAIQQSGRFADIQRQIRQGTISQEAAAITKNQIRAGLIDLVKELEGKGTDPLIQEVARQPEIIQNAEKIYNIKHIDQANFS